jgi:protein PhnA
LPDQPNFDAMARGFDAHQERLRALQLLGKDLVRRARSRCELTGASGVSLQLYEVPPVPAEPDLSRTLLLSQVAIAALEKPTCIAGREWRCLGEAVWNELPAIQVVAWRLLDCIGRREDWARGILDEVFLDPAVEAWARSSPL